MKALSTLVVLALLAVCTAGCESLGMGGGGTDKPAVSPVGLNSPAGTMKVSVFGASIGQKDKKLHKTYFAMVSKKWNKANPGLSEPFESIMAPGVAVADDEVMVGTRQFLDRSGFFSLPGASYGDVQALEKGTRRGRYVTFTDGTTTHIVGSERLNPEQIKKLSDIEYGLAMLYTKVRPPIVEARAVGGRSLRDIFKTMAEDRQGMVPPNSAQPAVGKQ